MSTCSNTKQPDAPELKQSLTGSAIAARVRGFYDELRKRAGVVTPAKETEAMLLQEYQVLTSAAAHIPNIKRYSKLENMLASALGWKSLLWQAPNNTYTGAGAVRAFFLEKANVAANLIESAALYKSLPDIQAMYGQLKKATPDLPESQLQELLYDQVAIGQFPKLQNVYDSPVIRYQLDRRYMEHINRLTELGLSPEQIATLDETAGKISGNLESLRRIAAEQGLDISVMRNGGYFPLKATEEIRKFLEKEQALTSKASQKFDTAEMLKRTRASNVPIVFDLENTAELLGISKLELSHYLSQPDLLTKLLKENLSEAQMQRALTNEWLMQTPALSDELTEFFNEAYDLPTKNLAEAIILDPVKAVREYSESLTQGVRNSSLFKELFTTGIDNGWVVTEAQWKAIENKGDYVNLGSNKTLQELIASDDLRDQLKSTFVHRTVAEQMVAVMKLNTSWSDLSALARTWQSYTSVFRKMAIVGTGGLPYLQRVFVQDAIALYTATGSLGHFHLGLADVFRVASKSSFDVLDNSKEFAKVAGKSYTKRQLFEAYFLKRGSNFVSGAQDTTESIASLSSPVEFFRNFKPAMERYVRLTQEYHKRYSSPFTGNMMTAAELATKAAGSLLDAPYKALAGLNVQIDTAARWAAVQELATNGKRTWADLDELIRYTDEYFNIQEDAGSFGRAYGSVGVPFAAFALNAPGSAIRHAIRNPWQAGRMGLLYSQASIGKDLSDAEMSQWQKDSYAISLYTDPDTGNQYAVMPGTVDFYLETGVQLREFTEDIGRALGLNVGSAKEVYEQERDPAKPVMDFVKGLFEDTYVYEPLMNGVLQKNTLTGEDISKDTSSLLGVPMKKGIRNALVSLFPLLKKGDELLPISGTRKTIDPVTQLPIEPGVPSWTGYTPTDSGQKSRNKGTQNSALAWLANNVLGLSVQEISPVKNLIGNYKSFSTVDSDLAEAINNTEDAILLEKDESRKQQMIDEMQHMQRLRVWTDFQKWQIDQHAKEYGIPSIQLVEKLRQGIDIPRNKALDVQLYIRYKLEEQSKGTGN